MQWRFSGGRPVYQQIMEQIQGAILAGQLPPGSRVMAVRELAMEANVNPNTMQRALAELEREELLVCCGTMGRFVTSDQTVLDGLRLRLQKQTALECARQLQAVGLTLEQAAEILQEGENA